MVKLSRDKKKLSFKRNMGLFHKYCRDPSCIKSRPEVSHKSYTTLKRSCSHVLHDYLCHIIINTCHSSGRKLSKWPSGAGRWTKTREPDTTTRWIFRTGWKTSLAKQTPARQCIRSCPRRSSAWAIRWSASSSAKRPTIFVWLTNIIVNRQYLC